MKKEVILLLAIFICSLVSASAAEETIIAQAQFDKPIEQNHENPKLIVLDDSLYYFSLMDERILRWEFNKVNMENFAPLPKRPVEALAVPYTDMKGAVRTAMEESVTHILAGDGKLWALNQYSGSFGILSESGPDYTVKLNLEGLNPEGFSDVIYSGFVNENYLYLFSSLAPNPFFAKYDIKTGERTDTLISSEDSDGFAMFYNSTEAFYIINTQTEQSSGYAEKLNILNLSTGELRPVKLSMPKIRGNANIKGIYTVNSSEDIYCIVYVVDTNNYNLFVFDKDGLLKKNIILPAPSEVEGFYYICQPLDEKTFIAVDSYKAVLYDISKLEK